MLEQCGIQFVILRPQYRMGIRKEETVYIGEKRKPRVEQREIKRNPAEYHITLGYLVTVPIKMVFVKILLDFAQTERTKIYFLRNTIEEPA